MSDRGLLARLQEVLDAGVVETGPQEARWIVEAASDDAHALELARRRAAGEPLQYITGEAYFRRLKLQVGPGVLIPRPETEIVTERVLEHLPQKGVAVDVGTGSGAIALAIKDERPDVTVYATEKEAAALEWARRNIAGLALDVELVSGDLLAALPSTLTGSIDVIVSNPPYVATDEADSLPVDVVDHEPHAALFAGTDGMAIVARLVDDARSWIRPGGWLVIEITRERSYECESLLAEAGYHDVSILPDLTGSPRIAEGRKP